MAINIPADGHYVLANAGVPHAAMDEASSGALSRFDLTIADGKITGIVAAGRASGLNVIDLDAEIVLPANNPDLAKSLELAQ